MIILSEVVSYKNGESKSITVYFTRRKPVFCLKTHIEAGTSRQIPQKLAVRLELVLLYIIQNQTLATFSAIEKVPVGRKKSTRGLHVARGPYVVEACLMASMYLAKAAQPK